MFESEIEFFRSLIIFTMLLVKLKELANCDKSLTGEGSRGFTFRLMANACTGGVMHITL